MIGDRDSSAFDYSPPLSMELSVHGECFSVASMGLNGLSVRSPKPVAPGHGRITLKVGDEVTTFNVVLSGGIDPLRRLQPYEILSSATEAAA
jgi:hypothetical protein